MANNRPLDMTKKSNIKCEHCDNYVANLNRCKIDRSFKVYYQRCKNFAWAERYLKGADDETDRR